MRILRESESRTHGDLLNCKLYVRKNLVVVTASEWWYDFVGENSYLPLCDLIEPEDGQIMKDAIGNLTKPVELYTKLTNRKDEAGRNVYLRMEHCDRTEEGIPLCQVTILDIVDMERRLEKTEHLVAKYRHYMTLKNEYYFEYTLADNQIVIYRYANERSVVAWRSSLEEFVLKQAEKHHPTKAQTEQMRAFCAYLKNRSHSFEMDFSMDNEGQTVRCHVQGGTFSRDADMVAGVFATDQTEEGEAYYLTAAAKDAGTGLLNKKAVMEYTIEKIQDVEGEHGWILIMDIDDFKNINDSFGHLFGDKVIRGVAEILQSNVGSRGIVGRFGGDEFFMLLDRVDTRQNLKTLLKTIVKQLANAFDPKVKVTVSIGACQYPKDGNTFEELFGKADKALYIAKEKGKNRHIIYDQEMHGAYDKDSVQTQAVAYAVSKDKRREVLMDVISNIYRQGAGYVTERPDVQNDIRNLYDLDGFTVYGDYGKKVLCRSGAYVCEAPDANGQLTEESYQALFGEEDVLIENTIGKLQTQHPGFYQMARKQEIGATLRCIAKKDGVPYAMVHFDIFNQNRKWSDMDIEMLSLIGCCLSKMICSEQNES